MLLQDNEIDVPESYLRDALKTTERGAYLSDVPAALQEFGAEREYIYRPDLQIEDLREAVRQGSSAIVHLRTRLTNGPHAILVDGVEDNFVLIRDPLPVGTGSAYKISLDEFQKSWLSEKSGRGVAVVVK